MQPSQEEVAQHYKGNVINRDLVRGTNGIQNVRTVKILLERNTVGIQSVERGISHGEM
jgi:hypothetical protein